MVRGLRIRELFARTVRGLTPRAHRAKGLDGLSYKGELIPDDRRRKKVQLPGDHGCSPAIRSAASARRWTSRRAASAR